MLGVLVWFVPVGLAGLGVFGGMGCLCLYFLGEEDLASRGIGSQLTPACRISTGQDSGLPDIAVTPTCRISSLLLFETI